MAISWHLLGDFGKYLVLERRPRQTERRHKDAIKTPNNLRNRNKPEKVPEGLRYVRGCIYFKKVSNAP